MTTKKFQASAPGHVSTIGITAKDAASLFFLMNTRARKCFIIEGEQDGLFFTVAYDRNAWPRSFKDVTKKTAADLPC